MKKLFTIVVFLIGLGSVGNSQEVIIGNQVWSKKNLNVSTFRNGDPIPEAKTNEEWEKAIENKQAAWCYYDNKKKNGRKYGKLYNWYAVNDPRGLAPAGWHIPNDAEWNELFDFLGGDLAGSSMKSKNRWDKDDDGSSCNGTNSSGFSGLPSGSRVSFDDEGIVYDGIGYLGEWWGSAEEDSDYAPGLGLSCFGGAFRNYGTIIEGLSVRCIKD